MSVRVLATALVLAVAGCTQVPAPEVTTEPALIPSLEVNVDGDSVLMTLHLTNALETPVVLEFPSAQRSDFAVRRPDGEVVWTWSMDKLFAQVVGRETLPVGSTVQYSGAWTAVQPGRYEAVARLVSTNRPVEIAVPFEVR